MIVVQFELDHRFSRRVRLEMERQQIKRTTIAKKLSAKPAMLDLILDQNEGFLCGEDIERLGILLGCPIAYLLTGNERYEDLSAFTTSNASKILHAHRIFRRLPKGDRVRFTHEFSRIMRPFLDKYEGLIDGDH